jgi:hypothetical protein
VEYKIDATMAVANEVNKQVYFRYQNLRKNNEAIIPTI